MDDDNGQRKEREFDAITFVLAGVLSAIVVGAIGYGVVKSSKTGTVLPPLTAAAPAAAPPAGTTGSR